MTKEQIRLQNDDIDNELCIMSQLQPAGLSNPRANPHFLVWECAEDTHNEYIATEFAANGPLQDYAGESLSFTDPDSNGKHSERAYTPIHS